MLLVHLFHILRGYVVIRVQGFFLERFMNICARRNLYLWDLKKKSSGVMEAKISVRGFCALRPVAKKSRCRVQILDRRGFPFFAARYRKRYALIAGIVLFLCIFYVLTSFVWMIDVTGNETLPAEEVVDSLRQCGVKYGTFSGTIDTVALADDLRTVNNRLAWVGIEVSGSKLKVEVKERVMPPEIYDKNAPANIVARRDGVVDKMIVRYGGTLVEEGDTVQAGQLLVSGVLDGTETAPARYVNSEASIIARTWYERREVIPLSKEVRQYTGEEISRYALKIFQFRINFYRNTGIPFAFYDTIETNKDIAVLGRTLPVSLICQKHAEYTPERQPISAEEAAGAYADQMEEEIKNSDAVDLTIYNRIVENVPEGENSIRVRVLLECTEDIAQKVPAASS